MKKSFNQTTVNLGKQVVAEFKSVAGNNKSVEAIGFRMKDGNVFVAATNDKTSPLGAIMQKLKAHYGPAADNLQTMTNLRAEVISITCARTYKDPTKMRPAVTVGGIEEPMAWTIFNS